MADLTQAQLTALASEINADSKGVGYAGKTNKQITDLLNTRGLVATDPKINAGIVTVQVLLNALVGSEVVALSPAASAALLIYFSGGSVDTGNTNVRAGIAAIFGAGTTSRANLVAAVDRPATRAETVLAVVGIVIDQRDVSLALNRAA